MQFLTVAEVASRLGVSTTAVYQLCDRRGSMLRHHRIGAKGRSIRIPADALADYLSASEVEPSERPMTAAEAEYIPKMLSLKCLKNLV